MRSNNPWIRAIAIGLTLRLVMTPGPIAMADPSAPTKPIHILTPAQVHTQGGSNLSLPPGYFLSEPDWVVLDQQIKDLQDSQTRLNAQYTSLKNAPGPGWWLLVAGTLGLVGGIYIGHKL